MRRCAILCITAGWLALPACGTQEIGPDPITITDTVPGADRGALLVAFAPHDHTYEELTTRRKTDWSFYSYHLVIDGRIAAYDTGGRGRPQAHVVAEGNESPIGYVAAGNHHFEITPPSGGAPIFAADGEVRAGSMTRLYIYGDPDALQGQFVSFPERPAAGTLHVSVTNLVRSGPTIEVVSCVGVAPCAPLSPALAFGQSYDADFPAGTGEARFWLADGNQVGVRQTATVAVPDPQARPLGAGLVFQQNWETWETMPANIVAAPIYLSAEGDLITFFN